MEIMQLLATNVPFYPEESSVQVGTLETEWLVAVEDYPELVKIAKTRIQAMNEQFNANFKFHSLSLKIDGINVVLTE